MTSILREVCRERLNQEWAQADKSLDNYKNVMSKESKLIDEGEIRKNILDKAANKILALPFPEQAVFHLYYAFHFDNSQINEILMIPYAHGMRISMLNYLQKWTSTPVIFAYLRNAFWTCKYFWSTCPFLKVIQHTNPHSMSIRNHENFINLRVIKVKSIIKMKYSLFREWECKNFICCLIQNVFSNFPFVNQFTFF